MATDSFGLVGTTIDGRYLVEGPIGEGGFGVVYRGRHLAFKHDIAIKCLKVPSHFTDGAQDLFFERFREEGRVLSRLSEHPSIVRVFDLNVTTTVRGAQVPYLVLEWLEGDELERIIAARRKNRLPAFTEREATDLLRPVIDALALAHDERIAHRDVKPANIFIARTKNGVRVKMLDFGIAKAMQDGESATQMSTKTSSGFHAFSPQYGAPEQFRSKRYGATGPWTDIHALGLILTELTSGRPALYGDEMADFLEQGTAARRPTPRARGAEVSDAFEQLCERALALDPRERFQDANELRRALDALPSADAEPRRDLAELVSVPTDPSLALGPTDQYVGVPARRESAPEAPASGKTEHAEPIVATPPDAPTAAAARAATPAAAPPAAARASVPDEAPKSVGSDEVAAARRAFDASRARNLKIGGGIFGAIVLGVGGLIAINHYDDVREKERFGVAWANLEECTMGGPLGESEALPHRMKKIRMAQMSGDDEAAAEFPGRCLKYVRAAQSALRSTERTPSKLADRLKNFGEFIEDDKAAGDMARYALALQALLDEGEAAKVERGTPEAGVPKAPSIKPVFQASDVQGGRDRGPEADAKPSLDHIVGQSPLVLGGSKLELCPHAASAPFACTTVLSQRPSGGAVPVTFSNGKVGAVVAEDRALELWLGDKKTRLCDAGCYFGGADAERAYAVQLLLGEKPQLRLFSGGADGAVGATPARSFLSDKEELGPSFIAAVGGTVFVHVLDKPEDESAIIYDRVLLLDLESDKPPSIFIDRANVVGKLTVRSCRAGDKTYALMSDDARGLLMTRTKGGAWSAKRALSTYGDFDGCDEKRVWGRAHGTTFVCDDSDCATYPTTGCYDGARVHEVEVIDAAVIHKSSALGDKPKLAKRTFLVDMAGRGVSSARPLCAPGGTYVVLDLGQASKLIKVGKDGSFEVAD
ncbi:MAG: serine/threonine protein kinase [Polyangiaceae bacterium]|jgi:serine/threonine protein kinase|nr:serine/threonine protein kinase [Polyangiaceae bacterium]